MSDITAYQLDVLRAMATSPRRRWHAQDLASLMPGGDTPPRPSVRRLVCRGLIFTHADGFGHDRVFWLSQSGYMRATGSIEATLPSWTFADAARLAPGLSEHGFFILRAMSSSAQKRWQPAELDSVLPREMAINNAAAQALYDANLVGTDGQLVWLLSAGHKAAAGRDESNLLGRVPSARASKAPAEHRSTPHPRHRAKHRAGAGFGCVLMLAAVVVIALAMCHK